MKTLIARSITSVSVLVVSLIAVVQPACLGAWHEPEELNNL
ncbi:hypothetical protein WMW72_05985 [Paenibacillus filicis]|uniref:Cyclic lactone autoinducer peptide n=1 Tax=Paenibacillus filicis TaxID=669464 RepID=A0ABU9DF03_9BACL